MSRAIDYRQLDPIAQASIYAAFISCFLNDTFEDQMGAVISLGAGMCGLEIPDGGDPQRVLRQASDQVCALLLEHGELLDQPRWAA